MPASAAIWYIVYCLLTVNLCIAVCYHLCPKFFFVSFLFNFALKLLFLLWKIFVIINSCIGRCEQNANNNKETMHCTCSRFFFHLESIRVWLEAIALKLSKCDSLLLVVLLLSFYCLFEFNWINYESFHLIFRWTVIEMEEFTFQPFVIVHYQVPEAYLVKHWCFPFQYLSNVISFISIWKFYY